MAVDERIGRIPLYLNTSQVTNIPRAARAHARSTHARHTHAAHAHSSSRRRAVLLSVPVHRRVGPELPARLTWSRAGHLASNQITSTNSRGPSLAWRGKSCTFWSCHCPLQGSMPVLVAVGHATSTATKTSHVRVGGHHDVWSHHNYKWRLASSSHARGCCNYTWT